MYSSPSKISPDVEEYITSLKASPKFGPQVVCHEIYDATRPVYCPEEQILSPPIRQALKKGGIKKIYRHQGEALAAIGKSQNVMVATPTSSGKSLIYNLPVLENLLSNPQSHALYLFPLKALSQDQLKALNSLGKNVPEIHNCWQDGVAAIYDGDTTSYTRRKIRRKTPPVLMTNPDMLHLSFLPFHENWAHFFQELSYIIIDEVHTYRGIFGSHVAWLLRRLKRLLQYHGKKPTYILSSATIGNPQAFAEKLTGESVSVITQTGAPRNKRNFLFLNPWDSAAYAASQLLEAALKRGLRTIVYTQSRKMTELISMWTQPRLGDLAGKLSSYRAGFLPEERREIEHKLSSGELLGVISTSALELGIDIGDLDICLLVGYPGSIMASWQRGGRVGRAGRESAVILLASEDALDQYYMNNPKTFFNSAVESAILNPANAKIIKQHLVCAAAERPLQHDETCIQPDNVRDCIEDLVVESSLLQSAGKDEYYASRKRPQRNVSLRGGGDSLTIINGETGVVFGEIDSGRALKECHTGAIYLHRNETWFVEKLDLMAGEVVVMPKRASFHTRPMVTKETEILSVLAEGVVFGCRLRFGNLKVSEKVTGYQKRNNGTNRLIATVPLELPVQTMETEGIWIEIPPAVNEHLEQKKHHFMGGLHAFEHVLIAVLPLLVLCDRNDMGGISCPHHEQTEGATIFIYDGHAGGSGLTEEAFTKAKELIERAWQAVKNCNCQNGCPACVHSPKCGSGNRPIDKDGCLELIEAVVSRRHGFAEPDWQKNNLPQSQKVLSKKHSGKSKERSVSTLSGTEILPAHYGVFDLETKYSAEEVGGWHRADRMGLSVGVVYDSMMDGYATYLESEAEQLVEHLRRFDLVVGFNNKRFDNRVLSAYTTFAPHQLPTLDLLEEVTNHLGYRLSLNNLAEHTLGTPKSGDGLQALRWYREGEIEKLCQYCRKDVEITRKILLFALEEGYLLFRNKAKKTVRLPLDLALRIGKESKK